jgi:trimethylamine--corrinoid protein Co-methyltransferase
MSDSFRPRMAMLPESRVEEIVAEAHNILESVGVEVEHDGAVELLTAAGVRLSDDGKRVYIPAELCARCLDTAPSTIELHDRDCRRSWTVGGDHTHFDPGSAALTLYDYERGEIRSANTADVVRFAVVSDAIDAYQFQSTGLIPSDLPESLADRFRLLISLAYSPKPVITGTFTREAFRTMHRLLCAVRGGEDELKKRPLAVFDCCPTAPLTWSELTCDALVSCARTGVPAETVSMPLTGATSPVTLAGAVVQHTAESLSGLVIHQLASPGAPFVYGGAPSCFDMRKATTPMGAVETMMIDTAYAQVGKHLGLPVHAYMGLSDAKLPDYQAGFESAMGVVLAALAGVNVVSGPGMLNFVGTQSLEKLVLDGEICQMAQRLLDGVAFRGAPEAMELLRDHGPDKSFLTSDHTRKHFREEVYFPSDVVDRGSQGDWEMSGRHDALARAHENVRRLLQNSRVNAPDAETLREMESIVLADARSEGLTDLPDWKILLP